MNGKKRRSPTAPRRAREKRTGEEGSIMLEGIIGMVLITIIITGSLQSLWVKYRVHELNSRQRESEEWAEGAMNSLVGKSAAELPATAGGFSLNADGTATLTGACYNASDMVTDPNMPVELRTTVAGGYAMNVNCTAPTGYAVRFVRRWRVDDVDAARGLRQITVAVFADTTSTRPLSVRSEQAVVKNQ